MQNMFRIFVLFVLLSGARSAFADETCGPNRELRPYPQYSTKGVLIGQGMGCSPVRCSPGNQDSTCITPITTTWQAPPTCPTGAGYTTIAAAQWIGSQYSPPQCNYQAPKSCPTGYTQTSASTWDGTSWSQPGCTAPYTPQDPVNLDAVCSAALAGYSIPADQLSGTTSSGTSWNIEASGPFTATATWKQWTFASPFPGFPADSVYSSSATGPRYQDSVACGLQNAYITYCAVNSSGSVDGITVGLNGTQSGQCNH